MRGLAVLIIIAAILTAIVVWRVGLALERRSERRALERRAAMPWEPDEYTDGELYHFVCRRPVDQSTIGVGYVHVNAPDFEDKVLTLRAAQEDKLRTLNAGRLTA